MRSTLISNEPPAAQEPKLPPFAAMPPRRTLQALLQSADKRFSAARALKAIAVATTVLAVIAAGFLLYAAKPIMLPITTAFVISLLLAPAADWLGRRGLPESLRAALVVVAAISALLTAFYFLGRPAVQWFENLPEIAEEARQKLSGVAAAVSQVEEVSRRVEELAAAPTDSAPQPQEVVLRATPLTNSIADGVRDVLIQIVFTSVLIYFLLATRSGFRLKAIAARPTIAGKVQTARLLRDMQKKVGSYMFTMLMINFGLASVVAAGMMAIGMPSPLVWGALAGVLNFVPYIGPAIVTILLGLAGVVEYDTLAMMAAPAAIYVIANFLEANLVTPMLVGVRLRISPLAIFIAVAFLAWLWGPVGAVIAIPLVVVMKTVCDAIEPLKPLGVLIGEIEIVKGRRLGFCRIETMTKRGARAKA